MRKRILCIMMTVVLLLSLSMTVMAVEPKEKLNISAEGQIEEQREEADIIENSEDSKILDETQENTELEKEPEKIGEQENKQEQEDIETQENKQEPEEGTVKEEDEKAKEQNKNTNIALSAVSNLKAVAAGKNRVQLSWNKSPNAEEYIIYRQIGKGSFSYRYITKNLTYLDITASGTEYNFYRIYPCYNTSDGKRIVGPSDTYVYAKATLTAADNLKAASAGKNKVKLTWNRVNGAEGYIIYRQIGKGTFSYRYMTPNLSYMDTTASDLEYNYYRVYPYYKQNGQNVTGASQKYVFAKGILPAVTGLKAQTIGKSIKLEWNKVSGAEGYIIYRQEGKSSFKYLYMKDSSATSYVDSKCSGSEYNYYRVYPYHKNSSKMIVGISDKYVYSCLVLEPVTELICVSSAYREITLRWTKPRGAEGYFVLRKIGQADAEVIGEVKNGNITKYVDQNASEFEENYYAVIPYLVDGKGQTIITDAVTTTSEIAISTEVASTSLTVSGYESYTNAYKVLDRVNAERKKAGKTALTMDKDLMDAAMQRAAELVVYFSHTRPSGLSCFTVDPKAWGENIAMGTYPYYDAATIMDGWMNSTGHRENILRDEFSSIGIGCFQYNGVAYWVQLFGSDMIVKAAKPSDRNNTRTICVANSLLRTTKNDTENKDILEIGIPQLDEQDSLSLDQSIEEFNHTIHSYDNLIIIQ